MCTVSKRHPAEKSNKNRHFPTRKKLWQLDSPFHCSIIGTCLSLAELRHLARKLRIDAQAFRTDYELHRTFVGIAGKQAFAAKRLHKYLDQKFRTTVRRFTKAQTDTALQSLWEAALTSGDIAAAYWALATHPAPS